MSAVRPTPWKYYMAPLSPEGHTRESGDPPSGILNQSIPKSSLIRSAHLSATA